MTHQLHTIKSQSWTNFDGSDWFRFLCPFLPVFSLHSIYIHTCMYNIMFPVYLYSLYIHESSLSTWHDFIWTLCIKRNDLFVCISWGIVSLPIRKSWFLSPVDSEYIHYFVHVAANIFWLTGLYRFILCIVAAFYSKDWSLMTFCAIFLICASCWYHLTMCWLFLSHVFVKEMEEILCHMFFVREWE